MYNPTKSDFTVHDCEHYIMLPFWRFSSHLSNDLLLMLQSPPQKSPPLWRLSDFIEFAALSFVFSWFLVPCIFHAPLLWWPASVAAVSPGLMWRICFPRPSSGPPIVDTNYWHQWLFSRAHLFGDLLSLSRPSWWLVGLTAFNYSVLPSIPMDSCNKSRCWVPILWIVIAAEWWWLIICCKPINKGVALKGPG